jgi:hypothetical protein
MYRVLNSKLSSKKMSSRPKRSKPKSISKIPAIINIESLLRAIILNVKLLNPKYFLAEGSVNSSTVWGPCKKSSAVHMGWLRAGS